ncbi:MAG: GAF domain-containing protein, partial [Candidatus Dormibacteria bacterium]
MTATRVETGAWAAQLRALHELAVAASGVLEPRALAGLAANKAKQLLSGQVAALQVWDRRAELLRTIARSGIEDAPIPAVRRGQGAAGIAFATGQPVVIPDYAAWDMGVRWARDLGAKSILAVPLLVQDHAIGSLTISFNERHCFTVEEVELMTLLAAQVAPAMEAARLHQALESSNRQWRRILATSPQAILNLRVDGTVASANRSALRVLGYGQEAEIRGRSHIDLVRYE